MNISGDKEYMPIISKEKNNGLKIILYSGDIFYATNIRKKYSYIERENIIKRYSYFFKKGKDMSDAWLILIYYLFKEYIDAYKFSNPLRKKTKKSLYFIYYKNILKIGITRNINIRLIDLEYEFGFRYKIYKILYGEGKYEKDIHNRLIEYKRNVLMANSKYSTETFDWNNETKDVIDDIIEKIINKKDF